MQPDSNGNDWQNSLNSLAHDLGIDTTHLSQSALDMGHPDNGMQSIRLNDSSQNFLDGNGLDVSDFNQHGSEHLRNIEHLNALHQHPSVAHSDAKTHTGFIGDDPSARSQSADSYESPNSFGDLANHSLDSSVSGNDTFGNSFAHSQDSLALYSAHSTHSSCSGGVYTTIDDNGAIYKHTSDGNSHYEGYVKGRTVYNGSGDELGYGGRDGKVYDRSDHVVGWVDPCGEVYNNAGEKVYHTTKGVVGGAVYLLDVYYGGVQ